MNNVEFEYKQRRLRFLDFLVPRAELVALPLFYHAHVRITYRGEGEARRLLKFEIATRDMDGIDR